jgi:hypothetical protein
MNKITKLKNCWKFLGCNFLICASNLSCGNSSDLYAIENTKDDVIFKRTGSSNIISTEKSDPSATWFIAGDRSNGDVLITTNSDGIEMINAYSSFSHQHQINGPYFTGSYIDRNGNRVVIDKALQIILERKVISNSTHK